MIANYIEYSADAYTVVENRVRNIPSINIITVAFVHTDSVVCPWERASERKNRSANEYLLIRSYY